MRLLISLILFLLVCAPPPAAAQAQAARTPEAAAGRAPVRVGEAAPDFTLEDEGGRKVSLSGARGRPVVLVFYRGWW